MGRLSPSAKSRSTRYQAQTSVISVGPYMFTPFHPTYVDTYFDTECHNWTADPFLCTMTCDEETAFLGNYAK